MNTNNANTTREKLTEEQTTEFFALRKTYIDAFTALKDFCSDKNADGVCKDNFAMIALIGMDSLDDDKAVNVKGCALGNGNAIRALLTEFATSSNIGRRVVIDVAADMMIEDFIGQLEKKVQRDGN